MFDLDNFVEKCREALRSGSGVAAIEKHVADAIADIPALEAGLPAITGDETLLHAGDDLTVFQLRLTPKILYPPHNHYMPVVIGLYKGLETNHFFRAEGDGLERRGEARLRAPRVHSLGADAIHAVVNEGDDYSAAIHVYCGNLMRKERFLWDLEKQERLPFAEADYFRLAQPLDAAAEPRA